MTENGTFIVRELCAGDTVSLNGTITTVIGVEDAGVTVGPELMILKVLSSKHPYTEEYVLSADFTLRADRGTSHDA